MLLNGYPCVYKPEHKRAFDNGCVYEHILVAENILGRDLKREECVHHIDKNRTNNNPENLMIFATSADHTAFHMGGNAKKDGNTYITERIIKKRSSKICETCGKDFYPKYKNQRFCSVTCANRVQTKYAKHSIDEIYQIVKECKGNFLKASRILGCTDNALRHRLRRSNFPYHSRDYN